MGVVVDVVIEWVDGLDVCVGLMCWVNVLLLSVRRVTGAIKIASTRSEALKY